MKLAAVAAVVLGMSACGGKQKKDSIGSKDLEVPSQLEIASNSSASSVNLIPDNAIIALKVMPKQLFDKMLGDPNSALALQWNELRFQLQMVAPAFSNPSKAGLNLDKPMIITLSGHIADVENEEAAIELCVIADLTDRDLFIKSFDDLIEMASDEAEISKDYTSSSYTHYVIASDEIHAFDLGVMSKVLVARIKYDPAGNIGDLKKSMSQLFSNRGTEHAEGIQEFYSSGSDFAAWLDFGETMDFIMPLLNKAESVDLKALDQYMPMLETSSIVAGLDFQNGKTVFDVKLIGLDSVKEDINKYLTASSGRFLQYLPSSSVMVANIAFQNLDELVDRVCEENEELAEMFEALQENIGLDDEMLAGLPGEVILAIDGNGINERETPGLMAIMECDSNLWEFIEGYLEEYATYEAENTYMIQDAFYISYSPYENALLLIEANTYMGGFAETAFAEEIKNGGFVFDMTQLPDDVLDSIAAGEMYYMTGRELLEYASSLVIVPSADFMGATITLNMGDQSHNLLEKAVEIASEYMQY